MDEATAAANEKTGRWTDEEHTRFLQGLELYGKKWTKVADVVGTRTTVQVRSHAQKYFQKLEKDRSTPGGGGGGGNAWGVVADARSTVPNKQRREHHNNPMANELPNNGGGGGSNGKGDHMGGGFRRPCPPAIRRFVPNGGDSNGGSRAAELAAGLFKFLSPLALPGATAATGSNASSEDTDSSSSGSNVQFRRTSQLGIEEAARQIFDDGAINNVKSENDVDEEGGEERGGAMVPEWYRRGGRIEELLRDAAELDWRDDEGGPRLKQPALDARRESALDFAALSASSTHTRRRNDDDRQRNFPDNKRKLQGGGLAQKQPPAMTAANSVQGGLAMMANSSSSHQRTTTMEEAAAALAPSARGMARLPRYSSFDALYSASLLVDAAATDPAGTAKKLGSRTLSQLSLGFSDSGEHISSSASHINLNHINNVNSNNGGPRKRVRSDSDAGFDDGLLYDDALYFDDEHPQNSDTVASKQTFSAKQQQQQQQQAPSSHTH